MAVDFVSTLQVNKMKRVPFVEADPKIANDSLLAAHCSRHPIHSAIVS